MNDMQKDLDEALDFGDLDLGSLAPDESTDMAAVGESQSQHPGGNLSRERRKMALFSRVPVTLTLEVASVEITLADLMEVDGESVLELDKLAGEPLDIKVNGILFGKAEVVVINDKYGLRIIEFNNHDLGELAR